jgi:hypothetical protein
MDFEHNGGVAIVFYGHSFAKIVGCGHGTFKLFNRKRGRYL